MGGATPNPRTPHRWRWRTASRARRRTPRALLLISACAASTQAALCPSRTARRGYSVPRVHCHDSTCAQAPGRATPTSWSTRPPKRPRRTPRLSFSPTAPSRCSKFVSVVSSNYTHTQCPILYLRTNLLTCIYKVLHVRLCCKTAWRTWCI